MRNAPSKLFAVLLVAAMLVTAILPASADAFEDSIEALMGAENTGSCFELDISAPETYSDNDTITITVSLKDVEYQNGFLNVAFWMFYDETQMELLNTVKADSTLDCIKTVPGEKWNENFSKKASSADGKQYISASIGCTEDLSLVAKADNSVVFEFKFKVKDGLNAPIAVYIPHNSVVCYNVDFDSLYGEGDCEILTYKKETVEPQKDYKEEIIAKVGTEPSGASFSLDIEAPDVNAGDSLLSVTVDVEDITVSKGILMVGFNFYYDTEKLIIQNAKNNDNSLDCINKVPGSKWENLSLTVNDGTPQEYIKVAICNTEDLSASAKDDGSIQFRFDFKIVSGVTGDIGVYIPHANTVANDVDFNDYYGTGDYEIIEVKEKTLDIKPQSEFSLNIEKALVSGKKQEMTVDELKEQFNGEVIITDKNNKPLSSADKVGTGCTITAGGTTVTLIINGDLNGDGKRTSSDYIMLKRIILGSYTLEGVFNNACFINSDDKQNASDYIMLKRIVLGSYKYE